MSPFPDMPGLDAVTDLDREWFLDHPYRRYRLRHTAIVELLPGQAMQAGDHTVVAVMAKSPLMRFRIRVGRPPARLRHDTDRCCWQLVQRLDEAGLTLNGMPITTAIDRVNASLAGVLREARP